MFKMNKLTLSELRGAGDEERSRKLSELVEDARSPRNGQARDIDARLRAYEIQYGMTSEEMRAKFRAGKQEDTADIARWLMLLSIAGK